MQLTLGGVAPGGAADFVARAAPWITANVPDGRLVAYGHAGYPLLMFPTAAADYLEYERFLLVDAIKELVRVLRPGGTLAVSVPL